MFPLDEIIENLKIEEGWSSHVYKCSQGFETIGYGRNISKTGPGISKEEGEFLLERDVQGIVNWLERSLPYFSGLDRDVASVLVALAYQLGTAGLLRFALTLDHIEKNELREAGDELLRSRFASQTPARAHRLAARLRSAG